jgi:catechol 2,3-dioxygenase-like lactoylglutathione lyase family enzyme
VREETFRDFRDLPGVSAEQQPFVLGLRQVIAGSSAWRGPSWPLLVHAAEARRAIAMVTARGHSPETIEAGLSVLVETGHLSELPPILGIYTVTNPAVRESLGATDPAMTVPSIKKLAIKHAVETALTRYGRDHPHRFGMSDDDPNNVVLAISAMRDCKVAYPDKRFFVINTNHVEFVKLEVFLMADTVTAATARAQVLSDTPPSAASRDLDGGNVSVYVSDMDRAIAFYTGPLGLPLRVRIANEWAELDAGSGLVIGLHVARPPETVNAGTVGSINIELRVTRPLEEVVAVLAARGVPFGPIQSYENVRIVSLSDPDGNAILLAEVLHTGTAT